MKYIYKLLALDKSNCIKHIVGFVVNVFILIMVLGLFLLVGGYSVLIIFYISKIFFKILIEANTFYKLWILFFLIVWVKIRKNMDIAKEIDLKLKEYFKSKDQDSINKYKMILMMLCVYISICLIGFSFYTFTGGEWDEDSTANIINIFIWATYLIAPIVAIWVFSNWKVEFRDREKYKVLTDLEENLVNIEDGFVVLYNYVKVSWDYKVFKFSRNRNYHNFYLGNPEYKGIFFSNNYLTEIIQSNYEINLNCIEIMVKNRSSALKYYNDFVVSRFKYVYCESDLNGFELYKHQLNILKQRLSTAATLISSDILDVKSSEIPVESINDWISYFNSTKNESIAFDLHEFRELSRSILEEIKEIKNRLLKD